MDGEISPIVIKEEKITEDEYVEENKNFTDSPVFIKEERVKGEYIEENINFIEMSSGGLTDVKQEELLIPEEVSTMVIKEEEGVKEENIKEKSNFTGANKKLFSSESSSEEENFVKTQKRKKHACFFCQKLYCHMKRHFFSKHKTEMLISKLKAATPMQQLEEIQSLIRQGDFNYNTEAIVKKKGSLILAKNPEGGIKNTKDYLPCSNCLAYFFRKSLWRHRKVCDLKKKSTSLEEEAATRKRVQMEGELLIISRSTPEADPIFISVISKHLKKDEVFLAGKNDDLILKMAYYKFQKRKKDAHGDIFQELRRLGRLLLELQRVSNTKSSSLSDFIDPNQFDLVVEAVRRICGSMTMENNCPEFQSPSLALKYGHCLRRCAFIIRGEGIRSGNDEKKANANLFKELIDNEWKEKVVSVAIATMSNQRLF